MTWITVAFVLMIMVGGGLVYDYFVHDPVPADTTITITWLDEWNATVEGIAGDGSWQFENLASGSTLVANLGTGTYLSNATDGDTETYSQVAKTVTGAGVFGYLYLDLGTATEFYIGYSAFGSLSGKTVTWSLACSADNSTYLNNAYGGFATGSGDSRGLCHGWGVGRYVRWTFSTDGTTGSPQGRIYEIWVYAIGGALD